MSGTTLDPICRGELVIEQPRRGYRFNIDAVLLTHFAEVNGRSSLPTRIVDLGAGVGVVGLLLAKRWPDARVTLIEIQRELADLARANVHRNGLVERVEVIHGDLRDPGAWSRRAPDLLVCNPPFFRLEDGRVSPRRQVSVAKHEVSCPLEDLLRAAAAGLNPGGGLMLIHAAERREELTSGMTRHGLQPERVRSIVPLPGRAPSRVLVLGRRAGSGATEELPPLLVEEEPGRFTAEVRCALRDG